MSSCPTNQVSLVKLVDDSEEDLVHELSKEDLVNLAKSFFQACIITSGMCSHFISLDHNRVDPQLQIRYLLRLVRENIQSNATVWDKFLILLDRIGGVSNTLMDRLKKPVSGEASTDTVSGDITSMEEGIVLSEGDVSLLTELLVGISHKWEEIAIALGLQEYYRAKFRIDCNKISLNKTIACWISSDSTSTLEKLKQSLSCCVVGESRIAQDLEEKFREAKKGSKNAKKRSKNAKKRRRNYSSFHDTNFILTISKISYHTEVADGKSTLLHVQACPRESASYQWKKDGQPLANGYTYSGVHDDILVVSHASQGTDGEYTCCVSKEGKEVCSNKIALTVIYQRDKKQLLNLYSVSEIQKDSWPEVSVAFVNLALIKSSKNYKHICDYSVSGDADDIISNKEIIKYKEAFGEYKSRELILLEGRPGSGKTTLVHKIIRDWTKGEVLTKAKLVFLVTLRDLNAEGGNETLSDLLRLFYSNDEQLKIIRSDVERINGDGVCFVIDGLDEYQPQNTKKSIIHKLLNRTYLHQAMIVVSSRPAATSIIKKEVLTKRIEVFGFSKKQIFEYIDKFPFSASSARASTVQTKLKEYLVRNPNIFDICYLPLHAAMICFLFKDDKDHNSYTLAKIYEQFTRLIIQRHFLYHNFELELHSLKELCGIHKKYFDDLCRLAFNMTINSKQVISQQELSFQFSQSDSNGDDFSLGLLTIYNTVHPTGLYRSYSFLHLTFQEFLAAYHIANLTSSQQMEVIQQYSESTHMTTVWTFYSGTSEPVTQLKLGDCHYDGEDRFTILQEQLSNKDLHSLKTLEISSSISGERETKKLSDTVRTFQHSAMIISCSKHEDKSSEDFNNNSNESTGQEEVSYSKDIEQSKTKVHTEAACPYESLGCDAIFLRKHTKKAQNKIDLMLDRISSREESLQTLSHQSALVFEVSECARKKEKNEVFFCKPFYTSPSGYRMSIRVDVNGSNYGKGSHVSVFAKILEGRYDDQVPWPFLGTVKYELLNQLTDDKHFSKVSILDGSCDMDIGRCRGYIKFIPHTALSHDPTTERQYLRNDKLYFRVSLRNDNYKPWLACNDKITVDLNKTLKDNETLKSEGVTVFKVANYSVLKSMNDAFTCTPFYTHSGGYYMCIDVFPNGRNSGGKNCLSVYSRLLNGIYDASLSWPFRGTVTFTLLNQLEDKYHYSQTLKYEADHDGSVWGLPKFISHAKLSSYPVKSTQYLKNDVLYFRIAVRVNNIKPWLV